MSKISAALILSGLLALAGCDKSKGAPADKAAAKPVAAAPAAPSAPAPVAPPAAEPPAAAPPAVDPAAAAPAPTAAGAITSDDEYIKRGTAMMTKLIGVLKAGGADCDKVAAGIEELQAAGDFAAVTAYEKANPQVKDKMEKAAAGMQEEFMTAAGPLFQACGSSQRLKAAFEKFE